LLAGVAHAASTTFTAKFEKIPTAEWLLSPESISGTTVADASGHGNTATIVRGPLGVGPAMGGSSFNGNQYVESPLQITTAGITVSLWFVAPSLSQNGNPRFVSNSHTDDPAEYSGFQMLMNNNGAGGWFSVGNGTSEGRAAWTTNLTAGTRYHYVGVYNGSTVRAYLNGAQVATTNFAGGRIATGKAKLTLGRAPTYDRDYFTGEMWDVRIYNRGLSAAEITDLYNAGIPNQPLGLTFDPAAPVVACEARAGAIVSKIIPTGGNGKPVSVSITNGDAVNFALSSSSIPSNVIVGPSGLAPSICGTTRMIDITPNQNP
jgi:hypothetical protein